MSRRRLIPLALILLLVAGTLISAGMVLRYERQDAERSGRVAAERAAAVTELAFETAAGSLAGTAGLLDASASVESPEFAAYARRVLGRGGLSSVGWLERVPASGRAAYEARTGLTITDRSPLGSRPAAARPELFPLTLLATEVDLGDVLGADASSGAQRRSALERAAASDTMVMTAPLPLFGFGERGLLLSRPVYLSGEAPEGAAARRADLRGFVVGAYRIDTLMAAVRGAVGRDTPVEIREDDVLVSAPAAGAADGSAVAIEVGGRRWTVRAGRPPVPWGPSALLLAGGLLVTLLATVLLAVVARRDAFATAAVRRATGELRESRRSHRALTENSPDIVARFDRDMRCTYMNPAITAVTGLPPEAFLGRTGAAAGAPAELAGSWDEAMRRAFAGEEQVEVAVPFRSPDGPRWLQSRLAPERDAEGVITDVLVVTRDVTRQTLAERALRSSEDRYRSLIATLSDGVVVVDGEGRIASSNPAAEAILGLSPAELAGRGPVDARWKAVREDGSGYPAEHHPAVRTLRTGAPVDGEVMGVHRPDGGLVWLSVSTRPRDDDDGKRTVTVCFTDITARVEAEREQAAVHRVAMRVAAHADTADVLDLVAREASALIGAEAAGVIRFDDALREGTLVGVHGPAPRTAVAGAVIDLRAPTATGRVAATGAVARLDDADGHPNALIPDERATTAVAAPIRVGDRLWGALTAATTRDDAPIAPGAADRLAHLCEPVALAIMSSEARDRLATLAGTDDLTGLPNRRTFTKALAAEIARARRDGRDVSLVMLDIDHFKRVNDRHGHPAGDRVLVSVATELFANVREGEVVARVGGEEFAWIVPGTDGARAVEAAERVRRHMSSVVFDGVGTITLSMGVCDLREAGTAQELMRLADAALYRAKEAGRDRIVRHLPAAEPAMAGPRGRV